MKLIVITCAAALAAGSAFPAAAARACSIHPPKGATEAQLHGMAKVSKAEAEKRARARLKSQGAAYPAEAELEAERGCLIWSFDMKVPGRGGVEEVNVDAGNGKILNVHHESAGAESREAAGESSSANKY